MERDPTSIATKEPKKLDDTKLRLAFGQYRETVVLLEFQLDGGRITGRAQAERRVRELKANMEQLMQELQQRKRMSPPLGLHTSAANAGEGGGPENPGKARSVH